MMPSPEYMHCRRGAGWKTAGKLMLTGNCILQGYSRLECQLSLVALFAMCILHKVPIDQQDIGTSIL